MGRWKSLGSLNSFLWYAPEPSGARMLCLLILSFLRVHCRGWLQQLTARWTWQWAAPLSPSWVPSGLTIQAAVMWWLDGHNSLWFLISQAIIFSSQYFFFMAAPMAYGNSWARSQMGAVAAGSSITAMAMWDPSGICDLYHSLWLHWIFNPLSEARDQTRILIETTSSH